MMNKAHVRVRRIYDDREPGDGVRVLVDRVWPRGLSREKAHIDEWQTPSTGLRKWYGHDPLRFDEFSHRYRLELKEPPGARAVEHLRTLAATGTVTLLIASKAVDISQATVLAVLLEP